ncbi:penicillin acylase [Pedobacter psychrotolerans]|nr:penicillin acylase [Pedobacter psychrotolerans]
MFSIPPLGKLLNPFTGVIQNDNDNDLDNPMMVIDKSGTTDSVSVFFDKHKIPHIFAKNSNDLFYAQGYVTASLRLWQMDFYSYINAGRLSEIFDKSDLLDFDRNKRRIGLLSAAKNTLRLIEKEPETYKVLTAYTRGVNAYIARLNDKTMPFEYKLLDYKPEPWSNLKTVLVQESLGDNLTGYDEDYLMSKMMLVLGEEKFNKLFPDFIGNITPVAEDFLPQQRKTQGVGIPDYLNYSFISIAGKTSKSDYNPSLGSNSWAVSGKKTKSGSPILASDPHLAFILPSFWLQMQLTSPEINVYGVSIPGTPSIIIGFNENVAWGITNGADDVKDWYKLHLSKDLKKYKYDGKWINLDYRVEEIKRRNHEVFRDTIYSSIHGPIVIDKSYSGSQPEMLNYALKWELNNPSNAFITFIKLNRAKNYTDYKNAINSYCFPTLNFTFACNDNTISVDHQGRMALKTNGVGRFILDGSRSSQISLGFIPTDSLPHKKNPSSNYVISANQHPTSVNYPYYYNGYYIETRANQIDKELQRNNSFDLTAMKTLQLSTINSFAVDALPILLSALNQRGVLENYKKHLLSLRNWKGNYDLNDINPKLFELWWTNTKNLTWDEFGKPGPLGIPSNYVLLDMIKNNSSSNYFDILETPKNETATDITTLAFNKASASYEALFVNNNVKWGNLNKISLMHMANFKELSLMNLPSDGHPDAINAKSGSWGPSWRMIVELGEKPTAFGILPGGSSGNIGSKYYTDFVKDWNNGGYYPLDFYTSMKEAAQHTTSHWLLK